MADTNKKLPLKPMFWSFATGVIVAIAVGFGGVGWKTAGGADEMVTENAEASGKTLYEGGMLTLACVANADADADKVPKLAKVTETSSYSQAREMVKTGWVLTDGVTLSSSDQTKLAKACLAQLVPEA